MKISFYTLGCKLNQAESYEIENRFFKKGWEIVPFGENADFAIINSCVVTKQTEAETRKIARRAKKSSPDGKVCVVGCYAEYNSEELAKTPEIDYIIGQKDKSKIDEIIENIAQKRLWIEKINAQDFFIAASADPEERTRAVIKIQDGCDYFCAYCAVPFARGASRSAEIKDIFAKIEVIINSGFNEIVLSGINLGTYKSSDGKDFFDLLKLIERENFSTRFRISSIEPNLLTDEIIEFSLNSRSICPHFHIPLQSGSNAILAKMGRRYNTELFKNRIEKIKSINHLACIGIDVIAGYPGETDELFAETLNFIDSLPISYIHAFTYSDRSKARASNETHKILKEQKKLRTNILRRLSDEKKATFYNNSLNSEVRILIEKICADGYCEGWSDNYIRSVIKCNSISNSFINGKIQKIENQKALCSLSE